MNLAYQYHNNNSLSFEESRFYFHRPSYEMGIPVFKKTDEPYDYIFGIGEQFLLTFWDTEDNTDGLQMFLNSKNVLFKEMDKHRGKKDYKQLLNPICMRKHIPDNGRFILYSERYNTYILPVVKEWFARWEKIKYNSEVTLHPLLPTDICNHIASFL